MKSFGDGLPMGNIVYPQLMSVSSDELFLYCNTPCYGSPNLTLITVISSLVMHGATRIINSESSQMHF
jgi:hypothetical protein